MTTSHKVTMTRRQRPLKCRFCWVCFKYESTLVDHIRRSHGELINLMLYQRYLQAITSGIISGSKTYQKVIERTLKASKADPRAGKATLLVAKPSLIKDRPFSVIKHASEVQ